MRLKLFITKGATLASGLIFLYSCGGDVAAGPKKLSERLALEDWQSTPWVLFHYGLADDPDSEIVDSNGQVVSLDDALSSVWGSLSPGPFDSINPPRSVFSYEWEDHFCQVAFLLEWGGFEEFLRGKCLPITAAHVWDSIPKGGPTVEMSWAIGLAALKADQEHGARRAEWETLLKKLLHLGLDEPWANAACGGMHQATALALARRVLAEAPPELLEKIEWRLGSVRNRVNSFAADLPRSDFLGLSREIYSENQNRVRALAHICEFASVDHGFEKSVLERLFYSLDQALLNGNPRQPQELGDYFHGLAAQRRHFESKNR